MDAWGEVLRDDDLERIVEWVLPGPVPLAHVAAWVTFELTKNLAEVNQLMMLRAAVVDPASPGHPVD